MTIITKFNIHDQVFILLDNQVKQVKIVSINFSECAVSHSIGYGFLTKKAKQVAYLGESRFFSTKQELLESL